MMPARFLARWCRRIESRDRDAESGRDGGSCNQHAISIDYSNYQITQPLQHKVRGRVFVQLDRRCCRRRGEARSADRQRVTARQQVGDPVATQVVCGGFEGDIVRVLSRHFQHCPRARHGADICFNHSDEGAEPLNLGLGSRNCVEFDNNIISGFRLLVANLFYGDFVQARRQVIEDELPPWVGADGLARARAFDIDVSICEQFGRHSDRVDNRSALDPAQTVECHRRGGRLAEGSDQRRLGTAAVVARPNRQRVGRGRIG